MRYQVSRGRRVVLLALLVPLIAFLFGAGSATAGYAAPTAAAARAAGQVPGTSAFTYVPLPDNAPPVTMHKDEEDQSVLTTGDFGMRPGETHRVIDQLDVRIPSGAGTEVDNKIICKDQSGNEGNQVSSGTNVGAGVNGSNAYQWNVSMLITNATQTGEIYSCQIVTYARSSDTGVMDVLPPAPGQTTYGTWLKVSSGNEADAQGWPLFNCPRATCCDPKDTTHTCQYIGGSGRPSAANLEPGYWLAGDDATTFDAVATFQITDCWASLFGGTDACLASDRGDGTGQSSAEGETWLDVDQLYPNLSVCQVNQAYSEESTGGQVQLSERYYDSDNQHHLPLYYDLSAPVDPLCGGSRLFTVDLYIGWTSGNPVKLDGGNINVINSARATTTVVPDVTGRAQAQAADAIEANGLTTWPWPDYVTSTAPVGTVLAENSPAGTIEPAGSPVQLTVSLGYATVPNVVGDPVPKAEAAIRNAGLKPTINSSVSNCVHPGIVLGQTPPGGTQVAPGSQVGIGITACTR
jgi:PASTA domain